MMGNESKFGVDVAYHGVSSDTSSSKDRDPLGRAMSAPKIELGNHPQMSKKRGWLGTIIWQFLTFLWLVPVIALLYLNFTEYVIGASAWCFVGECYLNAFNPVTSVPQENMRKFDKDSHDLLGGLQFVAKALEVWFGLIAAALVYLITMIFAGMKEGLPIGYLTRPMEFAEVTSLVDPLLWVVGPSPLGARSRDEKRLGRRVWFLIAFSVFLCLLINLMGPATAVLVIPALNWIDTPKVGNRTFEAMNSASPPGVGLDSWFWWATGSCTNQDFVVQNYTCTQNPYGDSLDAWLDSYSAGGSGVANQWNLNFMINSTSQASSKNGQDASFSDYIFWAPSRQIISNISTDYDVVSLLSQGYNESATMAELNGPDYNEFPEPISTYTEYNKSLQLNLQRYGPILGTVSNKWFDYNNRYSWTMDVDAHRQVRCYAYYDLYYAPLAEGTATGNYTKCIRIGSGWSPLNKQATFYAPGVYDEDTQKLGANISVNVYSSDLATYLPNGTLPSWLPAACLSTGSVLNKTICDWNRLFTPNPLDPMANRTANASTMEFSMANGNGSTTLVVDFNAYLSFTTYSFDPFPFSNPLAYVQNEQIPSNGTSVSVDPTWILAAWSVGAGGTLLPNRTATNMLQGVMSALSSIESTPNLDLDSYTSDKLDYISIVPIFQALSIIDHSTDIRTGSNKNTNHDPLHPLLTRNARMYVWSYGITSRTAYVGITVAVLGCGVVLMQLVLAFADRRHYRSVTQLLVAALEHSPRNEFDGKHHDEKAMARVRFHIKDDDNHVGKFSFYEPEVEEKSEGLL